jgi:hypothetical protein
MEKRTLVEHLRDMADVSFEVNDFKLQYRGRPIHIHHESGSSDFLSLGILLPSPTSGEGAPHALGSPHRASGKGRIEAERPLDIKLRHETDGDVRGKEIGINREVQIGDPAFDENIYIDTPSDDRVVQAIFADSDARAAVLELLEKDVSSIIIDDKTGLITLFIIEFRRLEEDRLRLHRILTAFVRLVDALPEVIASPTKRRPDLLNTALPWGGGLALLGFGVALFSYAPLSPQSCNVRSFIRDDSDFVCSVSPDCCGPAYLGLGVGTIASALFAAIFFFTIRGKSNSHRQMLAAIIITSALCLELGVLIARLAW